MESITGITVPTQITMNFRMALVCSIFLFQNKICSTFAQIQTFTFLVKGPALFVIKNHERVKTI